MTTRQELANRWREAAQITRPDIFGLDHVLRPVYWEGTSVLNEQIDIPALGMVGQHYCSDIAILSVNPAGGKDHVSPPRSDRMYAAFRTMREVAPGAPALAAFEALNRAFLTSMPDWTVTTHHTNKILNAAQRSLDDLAYLYLVPFRTRGDAGSSMPQPFLDAGYRRHLRLQVRAVAPKVIITIDRPSERAALRYQREAPDTKVIYYTRQRDAHDKRKETLAVISSLFA